MKGRSGSIFVESPGKHKVLFGFSRDVWSIWGFHLGVAYFALLFYLFGASPLPLNVEYIFGGIQHLLMMVVQQWVVIVEFSAWVELCQFIQQNHCVEAVESAVGSSRNPAEFPLPSTRQLLVQLHAVELRACAQFAALPWPVPLISVVFCQGYEAVRTHQAPSCGGLRAPSRPGLPNVIAISKLKIVLLFLPTYSIRIFLITFA